MSEFLAEARVLVRPDTTKFRAELLEAVQRVSREAAVIIPVTLAGGVGGISAVAGATSALANAQREATVTTLGLQSGLALENSALGKQAVILPVVTRETLEKAGADATAGTAAASHAVAQGQVGKAAIASTAGMLGLRGAVLTAGTAFIAATVGFQALGKAIGSFVNFQRELNVFQVTAGATADEMERVREVSRELGRDITLPGVAANDAAQALSLLARAGLSVEDSLGAVRGTLQLATAAEIDNAAAAELVANALNSFKLGGTEATRVADLLAGAAAQSQGSIVDMGLALKQVSAIASGLGIPLEATVTILTQLSRAGLSASDAGTSFRQTLLRLIQDLPKVDAEVERLGLNLRDAAGNIRPEVFEELGKKLKTLAPAARQLAIANLGGADAIRTLLILTRAQAGEFETLEASITRAGIAQEQAAARTKGLGGDVESAKNQFADLGLTVGQVASGPLSLLVRTAGQAAGAINDVAAAAERAGGSGGFLTQLNKVVSDFAGSFGRLNLQFREGVRAAQAVSDRFSVLDASAQGATGAVEALAAALRNAASATLAKQSQPKDEGLGVQQVLNRVKGFDSAEVRARIHGDNVELLAVLQAEQDFLIQQLDRQFVQNRPALRDALQNSLLGVTNDIEAISKSGASDAKSAAALAARAASEADRALLEALGQRREDAQRKIAAASDTPGVQDDIRRQNTLQALIKIQIQKIRARIKDEQARKDAIRALRIALIASRQEEERLRQEQVAAAVAAQQETINLDITFAETTGNVNREVAARERLIALLRKQQAKVKKGTIEWKRLRNEIAEQQQAIKEAREQNEKGKEETNNFAQQAFEFLQTQQGFASNLLGNLIPGFATGGLVGGGGGAAATTPGGAFPGALSPEEHGFGPGLAAESALAGSRDRGVRPVQVDTTNQLLRAILRSLQNLNGRAGHPEARYNRDVANAHMDGPGV